MNISTISATSYSTYITCPYAFKLKYYYKLVLPKNEVFVIGKATHKALQMHHQGAEANRIISEIKKIFLIPPIDKNKINNFALVKKMFELYLKYPLGGQTRRLEYNFRVSLSRINCTLIGFMDRVTEDNEVIDYKTTGKDYSTSDTNSVQGKIYLYAIKEITDKDGKIIWYVFNKKKVNKKNYVPQIITVQPDISNLEDDLVIFYNNVGNNEFEPKKGNHCFWCLYGKSCKYKK